MDVDLNSRGNEPPVLKWKSVKAVLSALEVLYSMKYCESQVLGIQNGAPKNQIIYTTNMKTYDENTHL